MSIYMGSNADRKTPYADFGQALKELRAQNSRTSAEVSGAVEINESTLKSYESGVERPSEDILFLLMQHFNVSDEMAEKLWKLAGYHGAQSLESVFSSDDIGNVIEDSIQHPTASSQPIVYTDLLQVMVNNYGVIMNFMQGAGISGKPVAAARVGMSLEHARTVVEVLSRTLKEAEKHKANQAPKQLSDGNTGRKANSDHRPKKS